MKRLLPASLVLVLVGCPGPDVVPNDAAGTDARLDAGPNDANREVPIDASTRCVPDTIATCACTGTAVGSRRCLHDGSAYEACECTSVAVSIFVRPGASGGDGTDAHPYGTLTEARDALRARHAMLPAGDVVVWLHGGSYEQAATFVLDAQDAGDADTTITWRSVPGETARISGGRHLDPACFAPVPAGAAIESRLDSTARAAIVVCDLHAQGITDLGMLAERQSAGASASSSALELFVDGDPMWLARWPDVDADDPSPDPMGAAIDLYGTATPDVTGHYVRTGTLDGVSTFQRQGLVGTRQYNLHRYTMPGMYTAWFLSTQAMGYPPAPDPFWYRYDPTLGLMMSAQGGTGYVTIERPDRISHGFVATVDAVDATTFHYAGDRASRWTAADDIWAHGLFEYSWSDSHEHVTLNASAHTITLGHPPQYGLDAARPYYVYNLVEELTEAGEHYVDRTTGMLYLYPTHPIAGADVVVSMLAAPVVRMNAVTHVALRDLVIEAGRATQLEIHGGSDLRLQGVEIRNGGVHGISISDSAVRVSIERCRIHGLGQAGAVIQAGDRPTLTHADITVENSDIHDHARFVWMYQAGVIAYGAGITVRKNHIHDLPHSAILWYGNDHLFELNEIDHVVGLASDAGAIYAGRDWGARGNVIRNNLIRHVATVVEGFGAHGIYLDDMLSGVTVEGNIVYDVSGNAVEHGGGRDDLIRYNVWAHCGTGISTDARGETGINDIPGDSSNLLEKLMMLGYRNEPWLSRYPACAAIPPTWAEITAPGATWRDPGGTVLQGNLGWQLDRWSSESGHAFSFFASIADNVEDADPLFTDETNGDLSLRAGSPALAIPGFPPIPYDQIGIAP